MLLAAIAVLITALAWAFALAIALFRWHKVYSRTAVALLPIAVLDYLTVPSPRFSAVVTVVTLGYGIFVFNWRTAVERERSSRSLSG